MKPIKTERLVKSSVAFRNKRVLASVLEIVALIDHLWSPQKSSKEKNSKILCFFSGIFPQHIFLRSLETLRSQR